METTVVTSKKYTWNWHDFVKGIILAVLSPVVPIVQATLAAGTFTMPWKQIGLTAAGAFVAYMVKNYFTNSATIIKNTEE